jgi:predicted HD phosphohydrolase
VIEVTEKTPIVDLTADELSKNMHQAIKMHFKRMDEGTKEDFELLAQVHANSLRALPDLLMNMLQTLKSDAIYPIDRLSHSLQSATRALKDNKDEEFIVCCLLHDFGESLGPFNHGEIAASILHPFISEGNRWMLAHHGIFQTYYFGDKLGIDPNRRDQFKTSPFYEQTVEFCAKYDEVAFDPEYRSEPMSTFEPMLRHLLGSKTWSVM